MTQLKKKKPLIINENSPRKNLNRGEAFIDEVGQPDANTADDAKSSFTKSESGWQPMMASLKSKALYDPGFSQSYHNSSPLIGAGTDSASVTEDWESDIETSAEKNVHDYSDNSKFPLRLRLTTEDIKLEEQELEEQELEDIQKKDKSKKSGGFSMKALEKRAGERKARIESIYAMEENYSAYGRFCDKDTCVGVWKELLGYDARKKLGIERTSEAWKCPNCGQVTHANGSIADQTSGFSAYDTYNNGPAADPDDFNPVNSISPDKDRTKR